MPSIHVLFRKEEIDPDRLDGHVVVIIDVLFATSTIACALDAGAEAVWPAADEQEAIRIASVLQDPLLAGEYLAEPISGFAPAVPLLLRRALQPGRRLVYCTTNGTVALRRAAAAPYVYTAALVNARAVVEHVLDAHPDMSVLIVCSGSVSRFCLEDWYGAGHVVSHLLDRVDYEPTDAARAAVMFARSHQAAPVLRASRVGQRMALRRLDDELDYASACDIVGVVPRLTRDRLIAHVR